MSGNHPDHTPTVVQWLLGLVLGIIVYPVVVGVVAWLWLWRGHIKPLCRRLAAKRERL